MVRVSVRTGSGPGNSTLMPGARVTIRVRERSSSLTGIRRRLPMWTARSRWCFMSRDTVERETPITWHTSGTESAGRPAPPVGVWELAISATFTVERAGKVGERPPVQQEPHCGVRRFASAMAGRPLIF
jgi:hypothetical protein